MLGAIPYQILRATAALGALVREGRGKRGWDAAWPSGGSAADVDAAAEPTDRPQLIQRAVGRRGLLDEVAIQAEAADR